MFLRVSVHLEKYDFEVDQHRLMKPRALDYADSPALENRSLKQIFTGWTETTVPLLNPKYF